MRNILSTLIIFASLHAFGNGGPIDGSAVYQTGDIILLNQPNIELVEEELKIIIEGDYSFVDVKYSLKNGRYSDSFITYGFPIQFVRNEIEFGLEWKNEYLPEIEFKLGDTKLNIKHQVDIAINEVPVEEYGAVDMRTSWFIVDFPLEKNEESVLNIKYKLKNGYEDWAFSKSCFPIYSERKMTYDFSPASKWGDGIVSNFKVEIDASKIDRKSDSFKLSGLNMIDDFGTYSYTTKNFNLKEANSLEIRYDNEVEKLSKFINEHRISNNKIKSISTTSSLKGSYESNNLLDNNHQTAWVEGKEDDGLGEQIVIELSDYPVTAICLINGYTKSQESYTSNGRIKKILLELEVVDYNDTTKTRIQTEEVLLEDLVFNQISSDNLQEMINVIGDYGDGFMKVKKITITILEVYKGSQYSDTCLSEILILGYQ